MNFKIKWLRALVGVPLVFAFLSGGASTFANVSESGAFQLDGNAQYFSAPTGVTGADWDQLNQSRLVNSSFYTVPGSFPAANPSASSFVPDAPPENPLSYFSGNTKDTQDVSSWSTTAKSAQPKDEITDAYSAAFNVTQGAAQHQILYFGADRYSNSGNSTMGFWFFKGAVTFNGAARALAVSTRRATSWSSPTSLVTSSPAKPTASRSTPLPRTSGTPPARRQTPRHRR